MIGTVYSWRVRPLVVCVSASTCPSVPQQVDPTEYVCIPVGLAVPATDVARSRRALAWVHGFGRPASRRGLSELQDLIEVLAGVELFGRSAAASTTTAEAAIGWPSSDYWYLATTNRAFGALAVGEWNPASTLPISLSDGSACAFDTGGLLFDPPKYDCGVNSHPDRVNYVQRHARPLAHWHRRVANDLSVSHNDFGDYVDGHPPVAPTTENRHLHFDGSTADGRPWSWEARVAKIQSTAVLPEPDRLYWHDESDKRASLAEARRTLSTGGDAAIHAVNIITRASTVSAGRDAHAEVRDEIKSRAVVS